MKKLHGRKTLLIIASSALVLILTVFFILMYPAVLEACGKNPSFAYFKLVQMEKTVQKNHIYANEDYEVLSKAYELYTGGEKVYGRDLKRGIKNILKEDINNYYVLSNLVLKSFDKYSSLKTVEQYDISYPDSEGYKGLGIAVSEYGPFIRVGQVYENSSAGRAGFENGDLIFSIDGKDIRPMEYSEARVLLYEVGETAVSFGILRNGTILYLEAGKDEVVVPNVSCKIDGDVGILRVTLFQESSFKSDLDEAMNTFTDAGIENIIVDMRDNRGGFINYAVYLINKFIDEKDVLMFAQTKRSSEKEFLSEGKGHKFENVVVLVNENTCSSAEICSGALKDQGYSLVGTTTYGKAVGLTTYDFFGDKLVLATLTIELPETGDYNEIGLDPDVYVENQLVYAADLPQLSFVSTDNSGEAENIQALEEALFVLGYFIGEPDETWDKATDEALISVADSFGLEYASECDETFVAVINEMLFSLSNAAYVEDTQYKTAMDIIVENTGESAA